MVFATGTQGEHVVIDTAHGERLAVTPSALCQVPEQTLRICPADAEHAAKVTATEDLKGTIASGEVARGRAVAFYEYIAGGGPTKALVGVDGKARFVPADEICLPEGESPVSHATEAFMMNVSVKAGPKAFRPRSRGSIKRIVIHNTESSLSATLKHFGRPDANTSAHVVIDRDGTIHRVVEDQFVAFHAGSSKDGLGGFNATSLGIEVVAWSDAKFGPVSEGSSFAEPQKQAVIKLVDFWLAEYGLELEPAVLANSAKNPRYADLEYSSAALTIHRLTKADRGTDCPKVLFPNSPEGDEQFFRWREATFGAAARASRAR